MGWQLPKTPVDIRPEWAPPRLRKWDTTTPAVGGLPIAAKNLDKRRLHTDLGSQEQRSIR
jgi:hypothetical protein